MNILYIPSFLFILLFCKYVYNRYLCYNPKVKKFDEKVESKFNLYQINLFQDNNLIKLIHLNHYFHTLSEFNIDKYIQLDELFGINYNKILLKYNFGNKKYYYICDKQKFYFPMYKAEHIKNYVFINKIKQAFIEINNKKIDILERIEPFIGPNYNFYNDINNKILIKDLFDIILTIKEYDIIKMNNYHIKLLDTFDNIYILDSEYLEWNPNLIL